MGVKAKKVDKRKREILERGEERSKKLRGNRE